MEIVDLYLAGWILRNGNKPVDIKMNKDKHGEVVFVFEDDDSVRSAINTFGTECEKYKDRL